MDAGAFGQRLGEALRVERPPTLLSRALQKPSLAVTRLTCTDPGLGWTPPAPSEDAFLFSLQLSDFPQHEFESEGRRLVALPSERGTTRVLDLKGEIRANLVHPFDSLVVYLSRAVLDGLAEDLGTRRVESFDVRPEFPQEDPVIRYLGYSLLPALEHPEQVNQLFVDHVGMALITHVAGRYGGLALKLERGTKLAAWQQRRAEELLLANIDGEIHLEELARSCGLSRSHFARAFRATTGQPPHRWLLARRIERARDLLLSNILPIAEIGRVLGFADQSHFTRVFGRACGRTPAAFRRAHRP